MLEWNNLFNEARRKDKTKEPTEEKSGVKTKEVRTEIERDYDRILFSTPVRRLADKTQVFPLERNDSVRTRLTHSHEVSNLARSIGVNLAFNTDIFAKLPNSERNVPAMLAAIGLAHDLGNPPFGHEGESAIQSWFVDHSKKVFEADEFGKELNDAQKQDFLKFEGNAQTVRLLARLQLLNDDYGLNLTYGTLAALMKYPVASDKVEKKEDGKRVHVAKKKHNFFQSEKNIVEEIWDYTGLSEGVRHPLTYIMEACDDIAYAVLDAEDAVKKSLVSYSDLISFLSHRMDSDPAIQNVLKYSHTRHDKFRKDEGLSPSELNDISMQMFRVAAIGEMIGDVSEAFIKNSSQIMNGDLTEDLIEVSDSNNLCGMLKEFDKKHAYKHRSVLEVELIGYNTIRKLMDYFWLAISNRKDPNKVSSRRKTPFASYAYSRISENYRRVFENENNRMPVRYKELQLMTDMISGMTDSFAISLLEDLSKYDAPANH